MLDKSIKSRKEIEQAKKLFVFNMKLIRKKKMSRFGHAQMIKIYDFEGQSHLKFYFGLLDPK